ncbi:ABC-2 family transporter protein, partial [Candidatus Woesearchaeota archaeon]|nr:ABC-2 family transporter protein [Candidatus Woesearchaeota archaeon]
TTSPGFAGWTFHQVLLLQGIFLIVKGISFSCFFGIVWNSNITHQRGTFDLILIKPRNTLFMFICDSFDAEDIAKIFGGALITGYALWHIPGVSMRGVVAAIASVILGLGLVFSIALYSSCFIFRFIKSMRVYEAFEILSLIGQYPKSIYPKITGTIFTALLPIFLVAVFPAQALLGDITRDILISSISVVILLVVAVKLWYSIIKKYSSAGG